MAPSEGVNFRFPRGITKNKSRLGKEKQDDFGDHLAIPMLADEVSCFLPQTAPWAETLCCRPHQSKKGRRGELVAEKDVGIGGHCGLCVLGDRRWSELKQHAPVKINILKQHRLRSPSFAA